MGEYARSLAIAKAAEKRWAGASIHFMLSREAPYAARTPFPTTLLASSATFHSSAVIEVIERWRPDVVLFDNAGRTAQLRAAKRCGARIVYVSARRRQRNKAFRLRWMRLIDEHWIAYPEFIAGGLSFLERLKLDVMRRPTVRYLDVILDSTRDAADEPLLSRLGQAGGDYVLVVPGGGTGHPGARDAVAQFLEAARYLAASGTRTIFVGASATAAVTDTLANEEAVTASSSASRPAGASDDMRSASSSRATAGVRDLGALRPSDALASRLVMLDPLPQADLVELMRGARLVIANGGSTLLQSIACGMPCIGVPIAADQRERIRRCVNAGVVVAAELDADSIGRAAAGLLMDDAKLEAFAGRAVALGLKDGVEVALRAMNALLEAKHR